MPINNYSICGELAYRLSTEIEVRPKSGPRSESTRTSFSSLQSRGNSYIPPRQCREGEGTAGASAPKPLTCTSGLCSTCASLSRLDQSGVPPAHMITINKEQEQTTQFRGLCLKLVFSTGTVDTILTVKYTY